VSSVSYETHPDCSEQEHRQAACSNFQGDIEDAVAHPTGRGGAGGLPPQNNINIWPIIHRMQRTRVGLYVYYSSSQMKWAKRRRTKVASLSCSWQQEAQLPQSNSASAASAAHVYL